MKTRASNLVKFLKKLSKKKEIITSSVGFQSMQIVNMSKPKDRETDFLEEFREAVRSGDETIWRMWR